MQFSICVMANIDEIDFFTHAENLGYAAVWVADSQMLFSDCYAVLALAAARTQRLRLGPGTAICGTRLPPVQVAAVATLNRLAPGRIHLGIGTGNTAMRAMGQKPMRIKDYAEYVRVLSALLRGETVDYTYNGVTRPIKMLMHEHKYMNLEPKIPLPGSAPVPCSSLACTGMAWCLPSRHAAWQCRRPWPTPARVRRRSGGHWRAFAPVLSPTSCCWSQEKRWIRSA